MHDGLGTLTDREKTGTSQRKSPSAQNGTVDGYISTQNVFLKLDTLKFKGCVFHREATPQVADLTAKRISRNSTYLLRELRQQNRAPSTKQYKDVF